MTKDKGIALGRIGKGILIAGLVTAGALASRGAFAGARVPRADWEASISGTSTTGSFQGSLAAARASADSVQWVGCSLEWGGISAGNVTNPPLYNLGYCSARTASGTTRTCYLTIKQGDALGLVGALNQSSMLRVSYFTVDGTAYCSNVKIYNYSDNY
jgi:hypothetical protein